MLKNIMLTGWLALGLLIVLPAMAVDQTKGPNIESVIRAANKNIPFENLHPMEGIPGLYEFSVPDRRRGGKTIYYIDTTGTYLISGHIINTQTKTDLTAARIEALNGIDWAKLPLDKAIISGDPKGVPVAVFTDPECPFCKKLEHVLPNVKGLKIYTFLYPLVKLHPQSRAKSETIWCSKDRHKALREIMLDDENLKALTCKNPVDEIVKLGTQLGVRGTPTLFANDGRKHAGTMTASQLEAWAKKGS